MAPTAQEFLANFRKYLGVKERPPGSNMTPIGVEFGWNGVAWCAETCSVVAENVGFGRRFWSASTDQWEAWARAGHEGMKWIPKDVTPRPGDLPIWDYKHDGTANHISAVETVQSNGTLVTLGGNEQDQCQRAVRSKTDLRGYIRIPFRILPKTRPKLYPGDHGPYVAELQRMLNKATGTHLNITNPAGFGPKTEQAVMNFKRYMHMSPVDPLVGPKTWGVLDYVVSLRG